ncbi:hypothetical protein BKA70DRAFT_1373387 [Coprinopsis sp. MPI-PUGE-AT-0042]|nr:hypothetical protein BKA70DRAFT_1373387 [Coprinopsis sp. MPI-PUGE-AT-0042]
MTGKLVLVTGVTGFIAGHIADHLLQAGYHVRGTARGEKAKHLTESVQVPNLEFTCVDEMATSTLGLALEGVEAIIHVACPLPGQACADEMMRTAIDGTLNVLRQGAERGIKKFVVTSSFGACLDHGFAGLVLSEKDWGTTTLEDIQAHADDPYYVYFGSKILAEKAVWEFAKHHPEIGIVTILPGLVYGPYASCLPSPSRRTQLGTNAFPLALLRGTNPPMTPPWVIDVREVARAHVLALELPPRDDNIGHGQAKRFLVNGGNLAWKEVAQQFRDTFPDLQERLTNPENVQALPGKASSLDTTRAKEILGVGSFIDPKKTMDDAARALMAIPELWD